MRVRVISKTKQAFNGKTYYLCGPYFQNKGERLHRAVWEHFFGQIPSGYAVHHIDGDRSNNDISNLQLMEGSEHLSLHGKTEERQAYGRMHIKRIRPLASKWHGSDEGIAWHREHGKKTWENRQETEYVCTHCGKTFSTKHRYAEGSNRFCHQNCRAAYRRKRLKECA